ALGDAGGPPETDGTGFAHYAGLTPKEYIAKITLTGLEDRYALPTGTDGKLTKTVSAGGLEFYVFELDPLTSLEVTVARSDRDGLGVKQAEVVCTPDGGSPETKTTSSDDG